MATDRIHLSVEQARDPMRMVRTFSIAGLVAGIMLAVSFNNLAFAQKHGGILKLSHFDSPASMSILEEFDARRRAANDGGV